MSKLDVDERIMKEVDAVDWKKVSEKEAASFGLAVGFFRDSVQAWKQLRTAWGTCVGSVITMSVLALICILAGTGPGFALALIITHQAVRAAVLWWKARQAQRVVEETERQAVNTATELAAMYPGADARAA